MSDEGEVEQYKVWHYGYHPRTLPCLADKPNCDYLDALWLSNDNSMVYSGILWAAVGGILLVLTIARRFNISKRTLPHVFAEAADAKVSEAGYGSEKPQRRLTSRPFRALAAATRRHLLPDSFRAIFGRTTRLQVLILSILLTYLTIFSFIGMSYELWISPVPDHPGVVKKQNTMGIWSNRIGILAYAITPFSVLLASRESILSMLTGIPYQSFMFLHRWVGYIILLQSVLHALAWTIICLGLYGPQPSYSINWVTKEYMIYGLCAQFVLIFIWVFTTSWSIRLTGFEFFRKSHYVLAIIYIGLCWGHWEFLGDWMLCGIILSFFDRIARLVRTALLHHQFISGEWGFHPARAHMKVLPDDKDGDVVRLDFDFHQSLWQVGQHFYLCFPESSVWQSHPFTPLCAPHVNREGGVSHAYIFRAKKGETGKMARLAMRKLAESQGPADSASGSLLAPTTSVILQGPYGEKSTEGLDHRVNVLTIAGGTGITYVLPVLLELVRKHEEQGIRVLVPERSIHLVWMIRRLADVAWIQPELDVLLAAAATLNIRVTINVTRESETSKEESPVSPEDKAISKEDGVAASSSVSSAITGSAAITTQLCERIAHITLRMASG